MSDSNTTERANFSDLAELAITDAITRAEMWGDFAKEFLRLGMLVRVMRGPQRLMDLSGEAAQLCRDVMAHETNLADRDIGALKDYRNPKVEDVQDQ